MSLLDSLKKASGAIGAINPLIGLGTTVASGAINFFRERKQQQEQEALQQKVEGEKTAAKGFRDMINANLTASTVPNAPLFAGGGDLAQVLGMRHEQGGTPVGNVEMEKGETVYNDRFVFSDRIKPPRSKYTYAQISAKVKSRFKKKLDDPVERTEMERQLNELAMEQEQQKVREGTYQIPAGNSTSNQMSDGGPFNPNDWTPYLRNSSLNYTYPLDRSEAPLGIQSNNQLSKLDVSIPTSDNVNIYTPRTTNQLDNIVAEGNTMLQEAANQNSIDTQNFAKAALYGQPKSWLGNAWGTTMDFVKGVGNEGLQAAGNTYNILRGIKGLANKDWDETLDRVDFEDYMNEHATVDLDLIDPTREIAEGNKQFNKAAYQIAQTARGQGNLLSNLVAAGTQSAENVSDIVHRANKANVDITNKEKMHNAQRALQDSTNTLNSKIFNAQTQHKEMEWEAANKDNFTNMIERGIQGFSQQANARELNRAKAKELETIFALMPKESMSPDAYGTALQTLMRLKASYGR